MTTEDVRVRLRTKLESTFGAEEASLLMDRPPGGWTDLVTNPVLEGRLDALRYELVGQMAELRGDLRAEMAELRGDLRAEMVELRGELRAEMAELRGDLVATMERGFRAQTWRLAGTTFVAFGMFATLVRIA
jgi:hypothetical protein